MYWSCTRLSFSCARCESRHWLELGG
jgi:hypothetical protein